MKNWLGQEIEIGSVVYRGARDGNSSSFRVGFVEKINEEKHEARVNWVLGKYIRSGPGVGTCDIDTLVLIDLSKEDVLDKAEAILREKNAHREKQQMTLMQRWW